MKLVVTIISLLVYLQACMEQPSQKKMSYSWFGMENFPKNPSGEIISPIKAFPANYIKNPGDIFIFYRNNDSILFKSPGYAKDDLFKKTTIPAKKWKPAAQFGNKFFFIGTYTNADLPGFYFSFYLTKDWKSLMQLHYTNPGNLTSVFIFSTDSVNALPKGLVDPKREIPEAEEAVISIQ